MLNATDFSLEHHVPYWVNITTMTVSPGDHDSGEIAVSISVSLNLNCCFVTVRKILLCKFVIAHSSVLCVGVLLICSQWPGCSYCLNDSVTNETHSTARNCNVLMQQEVTYGKKILKC